MHARNSFKNKIFWKRIIKKPLSFLLNPVPFNAQIYQKQKGSGTNDPVALQVTKQVQKNIFIRYVLPDQVWWCYVKQFLSYSKNHICKFMQVNSWHQKLFHFHLSFSMWKVRKDRGKITKIGISRERKEFFRWNKNSGHKL